MNSREGGAEAGCHSPFFTGKIFPLWTVGLVFTELKGYIRIFQLLTIQKSDLLAMQRKQLKI
jgi:hypothetical protein